MGPSVNDTGPVLRSRTEAVRRAARRVREGLRALWAGYLVERAKRSTRRWMLRDLREHLPAGWYRIHHKLVVNRSARPSADLLQLRGRRSPPRGLARPAMAVLLGITVPPWIRLGAGALWRDRTGDARIVMFTPAHEVVIIAPDAGWVRRITYEPGVPGGMHGGRSVAGAPARPRRAVGTYDDAYRELRSALSRHLDGPQFEVEHDGAVLLEPYVRGRMLNTVAPATQLIRTRALLEQLTALAADPAMQRGARDLTAMLLRDLRAVAEDPDHRDLAALADRLGRCVDIPSHGDLSANNVIVDGDRSYVIDWDASVLGVRPAWFDALHLLLGNKAGPTIRDAALRGAFSTELSRLWSACATSGGPSPLDADTLPLLRRLMATRPSMRLRRERSGP